MLTEAGDGVFFEHFELNVVNIIGGANYTSSLLVICFNNFYKP